MADNNGGSASAGKSKCQRGLGCTVTLSTDLVPCKLREPFLSTSVAGSGRVTFKGLNRLPHMEMARGRSRASVIPGTRVEPEPLAGKAERERSGTPQRSPKTCTEVGNGMSARTDNGEETAATFRLFAKGLAWTLAWL